VFSSQSRPRQLAALRVAASDAALAFGLANPRLRLVNFGFNATYKITDENGHVFALRIGINSKKSLENVLAEIQVLDLVAHRTAIAAPRPIANTSGSKVIEVQISGSPDTHLAQLYPWLEGRVLGDNPTTMQLRALGRTMAILHTLTDGWTAAPPAVTPRIDDVFLGQPNHIFDGDPRLTKNLLNLVSECLPRAELVISSLSARTSPKTIHGDLHSGNAVWQDGKIAVLDFDDFGIGYELQDLAIALFYLRKRADLGQPLLDGYQSVRPLPEHSEEELEALIASRNLMLLSDLLVNNTAEMQDFVPTYVERTERRLRHYLATGRFNLDPA